MNNENNSFLNQKSSTSFYIINFIYSLYIILYLIPEATGLINKIPSEGDWIAATILSRTAAKIQIILAEIDAGIASLTDDALGLDDALRK